MLLWTPLRSPSLSESRVSGAPERLTSPAQPPPLLPPCGMPVTLCMRGSSAHGCCMLGSKQLVAAAMVGVCSSHVAVVTWQTTNVASKAVVMAWVEKEWGLLLACEL